jgi:hypothetical protein
LPLKTKKYHNFITYLNYFGEPLTWAELDNKITIRVKFALTNVSIFNEQVWLKLLGFLVDAVPRFERNYLKRIQELKRR